jgi:hypothetical protein
MFENGVIVSLPVCAFARFALTVLSAAAAATKIADRRH